MDNVYRLVLQCDMPYYSEDGRRQLVRIEHHTVLFDYVEDAQTSLSSDITTHPLVNGDSIADHMYRTPTTMSVNGNFSLQGNKPYDFYGDSSDRLSNIESFFERIKEEGIFCNIVKMAQSDSANVRFTARSNMVLTSISWTERQNSLGFSFSFQEAITAKVQTLEFDVDVTDPNLPAMTDASTLDFTDTILDMKQVDEICIQILRDFNLVSDAFLMTAQSVAAGLVVAGATMAVGIAVMAAVFGGLASIPGPGWIAAAVLAVAAGVAALIYSIVKQVQKEQAEARFKVKAFEVYEDEKQMAAEVERFANYVGTIHQNLSSLNDHMMVYGIPVNENQECAINVEGDYYVFKFVKNNTDKKWYLTVDSITDGKPVVSDQLLSGFNDLSELTKDNCLFRMPGSGYYVYLMNMKVGQLIKGEAFKSVIDEAANDLTNYSILITGVNMSEFKDLLYNVVEDAMTR